MMRSAPPVRIAPPVTMRTAVPVFASAPQIRKEEALPVRKVNIQTSVKPVVQEREERAPILPDNLEIELEGSGKPVSETAKEETERAALKDSKGEHETVKERLENLKIW